MATKAHTNTPRAGYAGLPRGWEATISRWRASTNLRFQEPLLDWAAEVAVVLRISYHQVATSPLLDLLMAPQPLWGDHARRGLELPESLSFEVDVQSLPEATNKLRTWLVDATSSGRMLCWIWLEGSITRGPI